MNGGGNRRGPKPKLIFDAERLQAAMLAANVTQEDLAGRADVDVSSIRRAKKEGVSVETAMAIAAALDVHPYNRLLAPLDSPDKSSQPDDGQREITKPQEGPVDSGGIGVLPRAHSALKSVLPLRTLILVAGLAVFFLLFSHRFSSFSASKVAANQGQVSNVLRLVCLDDKKSETTINLDFKNKTIEYFGDVFHAGKTVTDDKGRTYEYIVIFNDEDINFLKSTGKNIVYGGSLSRRTLIFRRYLGAGAYGDDEGLANFLVMLGAATLPGMQCEPLQKRL